MSDEKKSFTIKGARVADISAFNDFKEKHGFTQGKVFEELIGGRFTGIPSVNTDGITTTPAQVNQQEATFTEAEFTNLKEVNQELVNQNRDLTLQVEELTNERSRLQNEVEELKAGSGKLLLELERAPHLEAKDFVVYPSAEQALMFRKARPFLKRDEKIEPNEAYPAEFVLKLAEKHIRNDYSEIFE